jgi:hypothetical protein
MGDARQVWPSPSLAALARARCPRDATQRLHFAATLNERVAVFEAVEASHLALRLSHRP